MKTMIWMKSAQFEGWTCSDCAWIFNPSGPPVGNSLEDMKQDFERQRDGEFASHVCARHSRTKDEKPGTVSPKDKLKTPRRTED